MSLRRFIKILLVTAGFANLALAEVDKGRVELDRMSDMYRAITGYHVLVQGESVGKEQVQAALYDVERYVGEMESRYATDKLFLKDDKVLDQLKETLAKAHLQAAILHARGVDLEGSITQYEKAVDLLGLDPADWEIEIERSARPGTLSNAVEVAYQKAKPREIVEDLKSFWSAGVVTRFKVRDYAQDVRTSMALERIGGAMDPFSDASFGIAAQRFAERMTSGAEEFRVVLPAGMYRVASKNETVAGLEFRVVANGVPDPVILNPNTFSFAFTAADDKCRPTLFLNGIAVKTTTGLPYGTYRVEAPRTCTQRLPDKISVDQNSEVTVRTEPERLDYVKEGQPIFLFVTTPPGSTYSLRM
jgi:hypothetical protein